MASTVKAVRFVLSILVAGLSVSAIHAQQPPSPTKVEHLIGLTGMKENSEGTLTVEKGNLRFGRSKSSTEVAASTIQDVVTGSDSQRVIRGTLGTLSLFAPYGSGRFLSLFRSKLDTLTIQYLDADGGVHGAIFTMPVNSAESAKNELVAAGARINTSKQIDPTADASNSLATKGAPEQARGNRPAKIDASAISAMMVESDEITLPAEFQISLYENLIEQLQKKSGFQHVYREGDRASVDAPKLVILHSTVRGFKKGSEMARDVTTVSGETTIRVHCEFTDKDGQLLLARDIQGKVRFFGGNLKATSDFAKKAAGVAHENFSHAAGS